LIHPGERIVGVTTFNQPLPVQARAMTPAAAVPVSPARAVAPAAIPAVVEYGKLDLRNPAAAA